MQDGELAQQLNEGAFSEGVVDGRVERDGWVFAGKEFHPAGLAREET